MSCLITYWGQKAFMATIVSDLPIEDYMFMRVPAEKEVSIIPTGILVYNMVCQYLLRGSCTKVSGEQSSGYVIRADYFNHGCKKRFVILICWRKEASSLHWIFVTVKPNWKGCFHDCLCIFLLGRKIWWSTADQGTEGYDH